MIRVQLPEQTHGVPPRLFAPPRVHRVRPAEEETVVDRAEEEFAHQLVIGVCAQVTASNAADDEYCDSARRAATTRIGRLEPTGDQSRGQRPGPA